MVDVHSTVWGNGWTTSSLHAREPTTAAEIAEQADCSDDAARTHLSFYAELGIVVRHEGRPLRYERNEDYFEWRRVSKLARTKTVDELQVRVSELTDEIERYRDECGVDSPAGVDVLEFDAERVDDVYAELGEWATAIEEPRRHERARRKGVAATVTPHYGPESIFPLRWVPTTATGRIFSDRFKTRVWT